MIRLVNVSKYYYSANIVAPALKKISLEFHTGEFVAITGESGSGKSTLLNIISGQDTYDDGELYINGEETSFYDEKDWEEYRKNKMGFIFQNYNLIENYSAVYNVESALLIQGYGNKEARKKAKELLKRVGLGNKVHQRAVNLSSGQKQRLSIARALAKNTDFLVADEPTANLDSETGKQIMELLSELSRDKLILIVTHNYEEAEPYVSRKIRLHDGEVVSDTPVLQKSEDNTACETQSVEDSARTAQRETAPVSNTKVNSDRKIAWSFARMNITTQPRRFLFFMFFLILTSTVSFIFLGEIYSNWDDTFTKKYKDSAFYNSDTTRIVVKKPDGKEITMEDIQLFNRIRYVRMSDRYGFSNDINYYIKSGKDYEYTYEENYNSNKKEKTVDFLNTDHFMKSSTCITKDDLSAGRLPKDRNEIVVYSENQKDIGKEKLCYFTSKNIWSYQEYYLTQVRIVGILKEKSDQIYFSGELCNMLSAQLYGDTYRLRVGKENFTFIPVIGENLEDVGNNAGTIRLSGDLIMTDTSKALGRGSIEVYHKGNINYEDEINEDYNNSNDKAENHADYSVNAVFDKQYNTHSGSFIELSEAVFYQLFSHKSRQASLYIKDYINTDYVLKKLKDKGYDAISSYRMSSVVYDPDKVARRTNIIIKSILVLVIVGLLEIIIIRSVFKIQKKVFLLLGSMGMSRKTISLMNFYEMFFYTALSLIVVPLAAKIASLYHFRYLVNMMKYYNGLTFTIYIAMNLLVIIVFVLSFGRYLKHKQKLIGNRPI